MSKRRINKQQSTRIASVQQSYHSEGEARPGRVLVRFGKHAEVEDEDGVLVHCALRPNLPPLVAGDRVLWEARAPGQGVVVSQFPRSSVLERAGLHNTVKPVAANLTQLLVVIAPMPLPSWALVDSYMALACMQGLSVCLVLNKVDLPCEDARHMLAHYQALGFKTLTLSRDTPLTPLEAVLKDEISVFVGQSGVGKSSLITRLLPHRPALETGEISERTGLGRHTTSHSRYFHLPHGGALVDSPGVREFSLTHLNFPALAGAFPEFKLNSCRFRNCNHEDAPGCAILDAIAQNSALSHRYPSFLALFARVEKGTPPRRNA